MGKRLDLIGKKYGCLTAVSISSSRILPSGGTKGYWIVRCDCGHEKEMATQPLVSRAHKSCGPSCQFKWGSKKLVVCAKCGSEYEAQHRGSEEKLNRVCRPCSAKVASLSVVGKHAPNRLPDGQAAFNSLYGAYKRNAVKFRGVAFELTKDQFRKITQMDCHYCGVKPSYIRDGDALRSKGKSSGFYTYNGVDRIDSSIGYVHGNIVPCCGRCNKMKNDMQVSEFFSHIEKILNHSAPGSGRRVFYP